MTLIDPKGKKVIYVTACGRSGTTILGYLLGNAKNVLDLGEVNEWLRFEGKPNGFGPGTEIFGFWELVMARFVELYGRPDFERLRVLQRRADYHYAMLGQVITGFRFRRRECEEFRLFLKSLYQSIFDVASADVIVDSSKYPSRLWHLSQVLPRENLLVVHLRRQAGAVIRAMKSAEQGRPRSTLAAAGYYHGIEFLIAQAKRFIPAPQITDIQYESLMENPREYLKKLGESFGLNIENVIMKVELQQPLRRGYIFNGNRMRMQEQVIFRRKPVEQVEP